MADIVVVNRWAPNSIQTLCAVRAIVSPPPPAPPPSRVSASPLCDKLKSIL